MFLLNVIAVGVVCIGIFDLIHALIPTIFFRIRINIRISQNMLFTASISHDRRFRTISNLGVTGYGINISGRKDNNSDIHHIRTTTRILEITGSGGRNGINAHGRFFCINCLIGIAETGRPIRIVRIGIKRYRRVGV